jgi:branched-chain amino acid transport system permease protein
VDRFSNKEDPISRAHAAALVALSMPFQKLRPAELCALWLRTTMAQSIGIPPEQDLGDVSALPGWWRQPDDLGQQAACSFTGHRQALPVVILGGLTSVPGAIIGGLTTGVGEKPEVGLAPLVGAVVTAIWFAYVWRWVCCLYRKCLARNNH